MRIENNGKVANKGTARGTRSGSGGAVFEVGGGAPVPRPATVYGAAAAAPLDALLALQSVDTATEGRRRQLRRGRSLLDALDALRADLLAGRLGEGHLNQLMALVGQARERTEPGLDALLDDIELRVRVELAKHGRFPGL